MSISSTSLSTLPDEELIIQFRSAANPSIWIDELLRRYAHLVYFLCKKYLRHTGEAEDCASEVFIKIPAMLRKHEIVNFKSWLCRVAKNQCIDHMRRSGPRILSLDEAGVGDEAALRPEPDAPAEAEMLEHLDDAVQSLEERQRQCIHLFFYENKSYQEIMAILNIGYDDVRSHLQNAKRNLRRVISQRTSYAESH